MRAPANSADKAVLNRIEVDILRTSKFTPFGAFRLPLLTSLKMQTLTFVDRPISTVQWLL